MILSFFNWCVTALQCSVTFCCTTKWISYMQFWSNILVSPALRWPQCSLSWPVWRRNLALCLSLLLCVWLSSLLGQKGSRQGARWPGWPCTWDSSRPGAEARAGAGRGMTLSEPLKEDFLSLPPPGLTPDIFISHWTDSPVNSQFLLTFKISRLPFNTFITFF